MKTTNGQPKSKPRTPRLTPRGQKILTAWVEQPNVERAAAAAGVSTTTLWRYRQKPEFKKALSDLGRLDLAQALARFQQVAMAAANTKIKVMVDPTSPAAVRLHAAELILSHAREAMEREDLEARVAALEQAPGPHRGPQLVSQPADPEVRAMDAQMPAELSRRQGKIQALQTAISAAELTAPALARAQHSDQASLDALAHLADPSKLDDSRHFSFDRAKRSLRRLALYHASAPARWSHRPVNRARGEDHLASPRLRAEATHTVSKPLAIEHARHTKKPILPTRWNRLE